MQWGMHGVCIFIICINLNILVNRKIVDWDTTSANQSLLKLGLVISKPINANLFPVINFTKVAFFLCQPPKTASSAPEHREETAMTQLLWFFMYRPLARKLVSSETCRNRAKIFSWSWKKWTIKWTSFNETAKMQLRRFGVLPPHNLRHIHVHINN